MLIIAPNVTMPKNGMSDSELDDIIHETNELIRHLESTELMIGYVSSDPDEALKEITRQIQYMLNNANNLKSSLVNLKATKDDIVF